MFSINGTALLSSLMARRVSRTQSNSCVFHTGMRRAKRHTRQQLCGKPELFRCILLSLLDPNVLTQNEPLSVNQFPFLPKPILMYGMDIF